MRLDTDLKEPFVPFMVDFRGEKLVQVVRLKCDQINNMLLAYLRSTLKTSFYKNERDEELKLLMTRACNLKYEKHVWTFYREIMMFLKANLEKTASLEDDLARLKSDEEMSWGLRMAIVYRAENKKILRSQLHLAGKIKALLAECEEACERGDEEYRKLVLAKTESE